MTGNVALDVVIGLVFIFLLYSLLATVIMEIIATNLGFRARNLKLSIYRMLSQSGDNLSYFKKEWIFWIWRNRTKKKNNTDALSGGDLAEQFYNSPLIQKQASGNWFSKPSSISADLFTRTLVSILDKGDQSTSENIRNYFTIRPGEEVAESSSFELLQIFYKESQGDIERFKERIKEWYQELEQRSTGWYKKRTQFWLFFIGLGIAWSFNLNTLYMTKVLSQNNEARNQMVEMANAYVPSHPELPKTNGLTEDEFQSLYNEINQQAMEATKVMALPKKLPYYIKILSRNYPAEEFNKNRGTIHSYLSNPDGTYTIFDQPNELAYINVGKFLYTEDGKLLTAGEDKAIFNQTRFFLRYRLWGWVTTALALSLGAPFWFDLLNKLMQLRGSVKQEASNQEFKNRGAVSGVSPSQRVG